VERGHRFHEVPKAWALPAPPRETPPPYPIPEDAETTLGTRSKAAEPKSAVACQVREGKGEVLDGGAGGLPGGGKGSPRDLVFQMHPPFLVLNP
jgi:hypothetical protein